MAKHKTQTSVGTLDGQYLLSISRLNLRSSVILTFDELDILEAQIKRAKEATNGKGLDVPSAAKRAS